MKLKEDCHARSTFFSNLFSELFFCLEVTFWSCVNRCSLTPLNPSTLLWFVSYPSPPSPGGLSPPGAGAGAGAAVGAGAGAGAAAGEGADSVEGRHSILDEDLVLL